VVTLHEGGRHTGNSLMQDAGVDQELRMREVGHADRSVNDRYTHPLEEAHLAASGADGSAGEEGGEGTEGRHGIVSDTCTDVPILFPSESRVTGPPTCVVATGTRGPSSSLRGGDSMTEKFRWYGLSRPSITAPGVQGTRQSRCANQVTDE
jgi:hypothetical protein